MTMTSSRFALLDNAICIPGCCHICGSVGGDGRKFVDLGITVEFVGVIYFCSFCLTECVEILGFIAPEEHRKVTTKLDKLGKKYQEANDELDRLRTIANAASVLRNDATWASLDSVQHNNEDDEQSSSDVESEHENDDGSSESPDGGGREDVPDHASDDSVDF